MFRLAVELMGATLTYGSAINLSVSLTILFGNAMAAMIWKLSGSATKVRLL